MRQYKYSILFFTTVIIIISCNNDNFYKEYKEEDVWRLPLIKPYVLKNALTPFRENNYGKGWGLMFKRKLLAPNGLNIDGVNVFRINIKDSIIYGYGESYPGYPFIINLRDDSESIFDSNEEWCKKLKSLNVYCNETLDILPLFENFKNRNILPWHLNSN